MQQFLLQLLLIPFLANSILTCAPSTLLRTGVTCEDALEIVDVHNRYRQHVALGHLRNQPTAVNMLEMTWDNELAARAQRWANQCVFRHEGSASQRSVSRFFVGQNLAISWSLPRPDETGDKAEWSKQISAWFNEVYKGNYIPGKYSSDIGHFTQMIWSDSHLIGCGYSYYLDGQKFSKLYVCNYGPGGNIIGRKPYKSGPPVCSIQGTRPSSYYWGLCEVQGYSLPYCYGSKR